MKQPHKHPEEVNIIIDEFQKLAAHSYLNKYVNRLEVDPDIILFLLEILKKSHLSSEEQREQILSALFVQTAFSAHDNVRVEHIDGRQEKKPRQLTVLAGDFFSSLYYLMLVKNVHAAVLPVFSRSIQEMNEEKMSLHFYRYSSRSDLLNKLHTIESGLIVNIASHYQKEELGSIAKTFFLLKRLEGEKNQKDMKYMSAFSAAVYYYAEGVEAYSVSNWPTKRIAEFIEEEMFVQVRRLQMLLDRYLSIQDTPLYNRMEEWMTEWNGVNNR